MSQKRLEEFFVQREYKLILGFLFSPYIGTRIFEPKPFKNAGKVVSQIRPDTMFFSALIPYIPKTYGRVRMDYRRMLDTEDDIRKKWGRDVLERIRRSRVRYPLPFQIPLVITSVRDIPILAEKIFEDFPRDVQFVYVWSYETDFMNVQDRIKELHLSFKRSREEVIGDLEEKIRRLKREIEERERKGLPTKDQREVLYNTRRVLRDIKSEKAERWRDMWGRAKMGEEIPLLVNIARGEYKNEIRRILQFSPAQEELKILTRRINPLKVKDYSILISNNF